MLNLIATIITVTNIGFTDGFLAKFEVECTDCCDDCTVKAAQLGIDRTIVTEVRRAAIRNDIK